MQMIKSLIITTLFTAASFLMAQGQTVLYPSNANTLNLNIDYQNRVQDARSLRSSELLFHHEIGRVSNEQLTVNTHYLRNGSALSINGIKLLSRNEIVKNSNEVAQYSFAYKRPSKVTQTVNWLLRTAFYNPSNMNTQNQALLINQYNNYQILPFQNTALIKF